MFLISDSPSKLIFHFSAPGAAMNTVSCSIFGKSFKLLELYKLYSDFLLKFFPTKQYVLSMISYIKFIFYL